MIQLQIKGPHKKEIQEMLRQKSKEQKEKLQMLRIKYGSLKEYDTKKFTEISLPKIDRQRRKNDLAKAISLSVLNKIQQNMSLTDQQADFLAKLSPQKRNNRMLIKTQLKEDFSDRQIYQGFQQKIHQKPSQKNLKQRITKIVQLGENRRFSLNRKKSLKSIKKIQRAVTVHQGLKPVLDICSDSLSRKYKLKMKALAMQKDRQLIKEQRNMFMKIIDKRLSPSLCVIKKFKNQTPQVQKSIKQRTEILKKLRYKNESKKDLYQSENTKIKTLKEVDIKIQPFQVSLGPWGTRQMEFNC